MRVECDKLWNQVLQAHSRLQQEQNSGIEYVHHIVAHTLNHPEARWLGRWYLGETFPFAHESQFLTIVSTLLWRTLVQTTKNKIMERWEEDASLKQLPWCGDDAVTPEEHKKAMQDYLMRHGQEFSSLEVEVLRPILCDDAVEQVEWPWEDLVGSCHDLDQLHRACMCHFQEDVQHAIFAIQSTMEDRVPFIRELEQNQGCQLEHILNVQSSENANEQSHGSFERSMEFVFWFLKDRITFDNDLQWVLMHRVAQELDQHFRDNPSHNQSDSPVQDVAVLGREVGYVHAIKERMLDLSPHFEVYGAQDAQDMLVLIMKNGELDKDLEDWDEPLSVQLPRSLAMAKVDRVSDSHQDQRNGGAESAGEEERNLTVHGKGFDAVVNHHENLETRRRQNFYEKMDSFIRRGTQWAALTKVSS